MCEREGERDMGKVRVSEREREKEGMGMYFAYVFLPEGTSVADHVLVASFLSFCLTYVNFAAKALANCLYTDETLYICTLWLLKNVHVFIFIFIFYVSTRCFLYI